MASGDNPSHYGMFNLIHSKLKVFHFFKFSPRMICIIHTVIILFYFIKFNKSKDSLNSLKEKRKLWVFLLIEVNWWIVDLCLLPAPASFHSACAVVGYRFCSQRHTQSIHQISLQSISTLSLINQLIDLFIDSLMGCSCLLFNNQLTAGMKKWNWLWNQWNGWMGRMPLRGHNPQQKTAEAALCFVSCPLRQFIS